MMPKCFHTKMFILTGILFLFLPVRAYSDAVRMEYTLGFNGRFQIMKWTPITIVLENRGASTEGTLEVIVTSGSEFRGDVYPVIYSTDVELPHHSKKLSSLTVLIKTVTHEMRIQFRKGPRIMISKSVNLHPFYTEKGLAAVVDPEITPEFLTVLPSKLFPVRVPERYLPENWYGYEGVGMLIVNSQILRGLRERQYRALKEWVRQGGLVILSSEINYGPLLEKRFQDLMPMKISGHKRVKQLPSLKDFSGQALSGGDPFFILETEVQPSNIIIQEGDIPIIAVNRIGSGRSVFLAFDTRSSPFTQWESRKAFWKQVLALGTVTPDTGIDLSGPKLMRSLLPDTKSLHPGFHLSLLFTLVYLALIGLFYYRLGKRSGRRSPNSLYLLSIITLFSLISYGFFFHPREKRPLTCNHFLQLHVDGGNATAQGPYLLGLFSVRDEKYHISFDSKHYPVSGRFLESSPFPAMNRYRLKDNDSGQVIGGYVKKWSHIYFSFWTGMTFPLEGTATWSEPEGLHLMIDNRTPFEIVNGLLYFDNRFIKVDDIAPHIRQKVHIPGRVIQNRDPFDRRMHGFTSSPGHENEPVGLMGRVEKNFEKEILLSIDSKYRNDFRNLQLIGWIRSGIIHPEFKGDSAVVNGLTFIHWKLPVRRS